VAIIERAELGLVNLTPKVKRTDVIQSFVSQETPIQRSGRILPRGYFSGGSTMRTRTITSLATVPGSAH
jgi:hypothetical protein